MISSNRHSWHSNAIMPILLSTCARRLAIEAEKTNLLAILVRLVYLPSHLTIHENPKEEGAEREVYTTIDREDIVITRTIHIKEEEKVTDEDIVTTIKITIQTQCPLSYRILIIIGVSITHLAQGATITMSMSDTIVGMIMTAVTQDQDPGNTATGLTGTTMIMQGTETTGSVGGMITSTNPDAEEEEGKQVVMITMTVPPSLPTLNTSQMLIVVRLVRDAFIRETKRSPNQKLSRSLLV